MVSGSLPQVYQYLFRLQQWGIVYYQCPVELHAAALLRDSFEIHPTENRRVQSFHLLSALHTLYTYSLS